MSATPLVREASWTDNEPMFIEAIPPEAATGAVADYYASQSASWGYVPNYALAFSPRPEVAAAWNTLNAAVRSGMDRRRFELATIAAARALRSTYCTAAHSMFLRDVCSDETTLELLADDASGETLEPRDRAVYQFAGKVAREAASVGQSDIDALRAVGLSDTDIADVVYAAAARSFFTRVLDGLGAQLDRQTAQTFDGLLLASMIVGRSVAES